MHGRLAKLLQDAENELAVITSIKIRVTDSSGAKLFKLSPEQTHGLGPCVTGTYVSLLTKVLRL